MHIFIHRIIHFHPQKVRPEHLDLYHAFYFEFRDSGRKKERGNKNSWGEPLNLMQSWSWESREGRVEGRVGGDSDGIAAPRTSQGGRWESQSKYFPLEQEWPCCSMADVLSIGWEKSGWVCSWRGQCSEAWGYGSSNMPSNCTSDSRFSLEHAWLSYSWKPRFTIPFTLLHGEWRV